MTDARFVASPSYYDDVEAAILATPRGRWFLREFAQRNRAADTTAMLQAIERLQRSLKGEASLGPVDILRRELQEMSHSIVQTRQEIAAIKPTDPGNNRIMAATEELDAIVSATERATGEFLTASERLMELSQSLKDSGGDARLCDEVGNIGTNIMMACSFQDLTGQRTTKVVNVLRYLEQRVNAMIDIWGVEGVKAAALPIDTRADAHLLNGPAREGEGTSQDDIDRLLNSEFGGDGQSSEPAETANAGSPPGAPEAVAPEAPGEPIDQASIDALFA